MNSPDNPRLNLIELAHLRFENSYVRELPGDPLLHNTPRQVSNACYTRVDPTTVKSPQLLAWSDSVGELLGIRRPDAVTGLAADVFGGNRVLPGMQPYAARYGGHQFGHWAGQLGDGRAISLSEVMAGKQRYELQLKGAGRTPYSRTADGRAVLRSSVREFLCSEAMHAMGVPTTRALSLVATGEAVVRDMFYDGNPEAEPGAIVCRVAPSFIRFGHFEILAAHKELDTLKKLADYVILHHFAELGAPSQDVYGLWFHEICRRTAVMVAEWMRVGFVHGVMNTDNMSILGLTIDYGPYGWLEGYDLNWTPNTTDAEGRRYAYGNQPEIALWNLSCLAGALAPLFEDHDALHAGFDLFRRTYKETSGQHFAAKLGVSQLEGDDDERLLAELLALLQAVETDMSIFFRQLAGVPTEATADALDDWTLTLALHPALYSTESLGTNYLRQLAGWVRRYIVRLRTDGMTSSERQTRMNLVNPKYVLRNYLAQEAIDALTAGDASAVNRLLKVLQQPYAEQPEHEALAARRPEWVRHKAGYSALSCSS